MDMPVYCRIHFSASTPSLTIVCFTSGNSYDDIRYCLEMSQAYKQGGDKEHVTKIEMAIPIVDVAAGKWTPVYEALPAEGAIKISTEWQSTLMDHLMMQGIDELDPHALLELAPEEDNPAILSMPSRFIPDNPENN